MDDEMKIIKRHIPKYKPKKEPFIYIDEPKTSIDSELFKVACTKEFNGIGKIIRSMRKEKE